MKTIQLALCIVTIALLPASASSKPSSDGEHTSIVITFKDGHQQTFTLSDIAKIEFKTVSAPPASAAPLPNVGTPPAGRNVFIGKWKVGEGTGGIIDSAFTITLRRDGQAEKTLGSSHGTWTVVDGEARIVWDDGWQDAIRKAGRTFEKAAYEPGHTFSDKPSNVTKAEKTESEPI